MLINYADDNSLISKSAKTFDVIMHALQLDTKNAIQWFTDNFMQANPDKFQVMFMKPLCNREVLPDYLEVGDVKLPNQSDVNLLGTVIDNKLQFDKHVETLCKKAARQLNVMCRFKKIFNVQEKKIIYSAFILANFSYCPIVWHFCGDMHTRKMERIQERALRFLYNDHTSN